MLLSPSFMLLSHLAISGSGPMPQASEPVTVTLSPPVPPSLSDPELAERAVLAGELEQGPLPAKEATPNQLTPDAPPQEHLYSLDVKEIPADAILKKLTRQAGLALELISPASDQITLRFTGLPFRKAFERIVQAAGLDYRQVDDLLVVGLSLDMALRFPSPNEGVLDATYRCKHLDAETLAASLSRVLPPEVKIAYGPRFLSPTVDINSDPSGINGNEQSVRALNATENSFKVHDIVLSGPASEVRRGILLSRKFDRPRKQVRINVRIEEVSENQTQNLGLKWTDSLSLSAIEQPSNPGINVVDGIRMGAFSHTPLQVNATLNLMENKGKAKNLANPSLLLLDGERSFILSGQKMLYPKFMGKDSTGQQTFDVASLKVGVYLQVAVQIGVNNDVVLSLMPQYTTLEGFASFTNGQYPNVSTQEAQTTVRATSGEMVVLGGLKLITSSDEHDGIPILKDIPILGKAFSTHSVIKNSSELMIFLTPEILQAPDEPDGVRFDVTE